MRPRGAKGGEDGKNGENIVITAQSKIMLDGRATVQLKKGDEVIIKTPGGGGYKKKKSELS